jgi:Predicted exonuclease of the beta-lactamase fold involved in RNA processing
MRMQFLGAAREVTGSCTLLHANGHKILVDCGMEQGKDIYENSELPCMPGDIDCVLLTHAHIDHSGKLPLLVAGGYKGPIYTSIPTAKLCGIMLKDSAHIQEVETSWKSRKAMRAGREAAVPMYTMEDALAAIELLRPIPYHESAEVIEGVSIRLLDAGHLLGSASIEVTVNENGSITKLLFSGDLGNRNRPLIRDPEMPDSAVDYVVIESTYGTREHGERMDYTEQMANILQSTFDKGGNVVIPAFAVGRTQEMLYLIREIKEKGLVKGHDDFPVWIDSPLAIEATNIYSQDMLSYCDEATAEIIRGGVNPLRFPGLNVSLTSDQSRLINEDRTPKVILSASGMCEAGRIRHHLKHNLWRPESTILFVGYQAVGTLGRVLLDGATSVKLFGEEIGVRANIIKMEGISGHADRPILLDWLSALPEKPKKVFVNHGEESSCEEFAETVWKELGYGAEAPYNGALYDLVTNTRLVDGNRVKLADMAPAAKKQAAASAVFDRLVLAGKKLMAVIERNRGASNKDLGKFADQVNALAGKWEK